MSAPNILFIKMQLGYIVDDKVHLKSGFSGTIEKENDMSRNVCLRVWS